MEDNSQNITEEINAEEEYHKEPKQNYIIYTIISVLLFLSVYSGYKYLEKKLFSDYKITLAESEITDESDAAVGAYVKFETDNIVRMILTRTRGAYFFEAFVNTNLTFYEDSKIYTEDMSGEDFRLTVYPYGNEVPEYVYARCFVNNDNPGIKCYTYEYGEENYVKIEASSPPKDIIRLFSE